MTTAQLREVVSLGHEVQSHGLSHCMLTRCSEKELATELRGSRAELEQKLGVRVDAISMPFGRWDARVLDACSVAGYRRVYTSEPLPAALRPEELAVLGRFMVRRFTTAQEIERMVLAPRNTLRAMQAIHRCKRLARSVVGEDLYHHLWGIAASRRTLDEVRSEYEPEPGPR
jgi:peptidoglycan/xylan/chitin deacetylase (PgdA/CDA1 family)